jgi:predicted sulfurtransferase
VCVYRYVLPAWSEAKAETAVVAFVESCGARLNLGGRVRVAPEGLNATITGLASDCRALAEALKGFDESFKRTEFKYIDGMPLDRAFGELKVLPVKELVFYGLGAGLRPHDATLQGWTRRRERESTFLLVPGFRRCFRRCCVSQV